MVPSPLLCTTIVAHIQYVCTLAGSLVGVHVVHVCNLHDFVLQLTRTCVIQLQVMSIPVHRYTVGGGSGRGTH